MDKYETLLTENDAHITNDLTGNVNTIDQRDASNRKAQMNKIMILFFGVKTGLAKP